MLNYSLTTHADCNITSIMDAVTGLAFRESVSELYLVTNYQYMENYGAHQEPIKQYWKCKGGSSFTQKLDLEKIRSCPYGGRYVVNNAVAAAVLHGNNNEGFLQMVTGHIVTNDLSQFDSEDDE